MGDSEEESSTSDSQEIETQSEASIFSTPGPGAVSGSRSYAAAAVASAAGEAASAEDVPARNEHDVSDGQTKALLEEREKLRQERSDLALSLKALEAQLAGMTSAAELNAKKEKLSRKLDSLRAKEKSMREAVPENSPVGDGAAEAESPGAGDSGSAVRRLEAARVLANACRRVLLPYAAELSAAGDRGASPSQSPRTAMVSAFLRDGLLPSAPPSCYLVELMMARRSSSEALVTVSLSALRTWLGVVDWRSAVWIAQQDLRCRTPPSSAGR
eukprot:TRINITY_DN30034_c0_g2_i2.p1 TRINITY_DN30034_c0_g2~~TRINITY_DN30034_c0_g2_i2.p1  ORF type:complete len:272 (+),score=73.97 TRINITY_DN30034_c0_g2_i2:89-904(+)